jgi:cell fate (sporulation/competence/biofilm development) regulator YlbF (YheA/YmcA/DUF963 family)
MTVQEMARELAKAMRESDEFKDDAAAKAKAEVSPELTESLNDLHDKQMEIQKKQVLGEEINSEMMGQIQNLSMIMMRDPLAAEYLQAEVRFTLMVNDVYTAISEAIK